ncbi:2-amino-4-hydroxy-6-hydroxymethyldihydropteridine diphosphokinase [Hymenobacter sp. RP-2-7]|uniref:2-amino-4-hydroxy-6-hydroxymethyldihydropteridine pyrophosphokinase n=1 Tax=Hymenobacter polaris TaxID=2682546 RepID=A0A7Y0AFR5_9BACT|nr:2-amino-4-hydroxy-6-hydroxymethyldihydropteridine diphosphokinase [Hymenobacter polaris]NML66544.1 2-amino-4-hydroxy-6-hydroxymethyldihydropteridine diphosphokinase [Hymenobacter polaris]
MASTLAYLLLGSNLGDRAAHLAAGRQQLLATAGDLVAESAIYETAAWGVENQPAFLNQVLAFDTYLPAQALLAVCLAAEQQEGRLRLERWGARSLDVDVLLFGTTIMQTPFLTVPHPALPSRRFALLPLAEIAPQLRHPQLGQTIATLLQECPDTLPAWRWLGGVAEPLAPAGS